MLHKDKIIMLTHIRSSIRTNEHGLKFKKLALVLQTIFKCDSKDALQRFVCLNEYGKWKMQTEQ